MKIAIIHEWLDSYAGSERVVEQMLACYPQADLFVLCDFLPEGQRGFLGGKVPTTSFIQRLPFARRMFRNYLQLMPLAVEQFDLQGYDVVLSSSHAVAKGVITGPGTRHISYVHSPMRYAWDLQHQYLRQAGLTRGLKGLYTRWLLGRMRAWDQMSAARPDVILGNSSYIVERIRKVWRREAAVLHPPVDLDGFPVATGPRTHFLVASRQVPYKRVELVAEAFARMPALQLIIVGDGPAAPLVAKAAAGAPNITIRGRVPQAELVSLLGTARAFVFAAEEDFGIAMVEAQSCGTPLIVYGRGGARDIVREGETGLFFDAQTPEAIIESVQALVAREADFTPEACAAQARQFSIAEFRRKLMEIIAASPIQPSTPAAFRTSGTTP